MIVMNLASPSEHFLNARENHILLIGASSPIDQIGGCWPLAIGCLGCVIFLVSHTYIVKITLQNEKK
jgi:hypothetical protein